MQTATHPVRCRATGHPSRRGENTNPPLARLAAKYRLTIKYIKVLWGCFVLRWRRWQPQVDGGGGKLTCNNSPLSLTALHPRFRFAQPPPPAGDSLPYGSWGTATPWPPKGGIIQTRLWRGWQQAISYYLYIILNNNI